MISFTGSSSIASLTKLAKGRRGGGGGRGVSLKRVNGFESFTFLYLCFINKILNIKQMFILLSGKEAAENEAVALNF